MLTLARDGPGSWGDGAITLLLPPGDARRLTVEGGAGEAVAVDGRHGVRLTSLQEGTPR